MAPVIVETRDKLVERREQILRALGTSLDEFRKRAAVETLTGDELDMLDELDEIAFLLGDKI
jgi:hypothetical protein